MSVSENTKEPTEPVAPAPPVDHYRLMIAAPVAAGLSVGFFNSFFMSLHALSMRKIEVLPLLLPGATLLSMARNEIARHFYMSGAEVLLAVNPEISWRPETLLRILERLRSSEDVQIICAAPPIRQVHMPRLLEAVKEGRPNAPAVARCYTVRFLNELENKEKSELHLDAQGFGKIDSVVLDFAMIKRSAVATLFGAHPELRYEAPGGGIGYAIHNPFVRSGISYDDSTSFLRRLRDRNIDIWLLADAHMGADGPFVIDGNFVESL